MAPNAPDDPILKRFRAAVTEIYGDRVARVVLFGSRARGDAEPESDYDVAVFLRDLPDRFAELDRLADLSTNIICQSRKPDALAQCHSGIDRPGATGYDNQR